MKEGLLVADQDRAVFWGQGSIRGDKDTVSCGTRKMSGRNNLKGEA